MVRKNIPIAIRRKILERDDYTCKMCGFHKIYSIQDVPNRYKTNWNNFKFFKSLIANNTENCTLSAVIGVYTIAGMSNMRALTVYRKNNNLDKWNEA